MRPNLTENEINMIYQTFQMYSPKNGLVETKNILKKYETTSDCDSLKK